jgi:4-amino-4-deoxy-L-arabinose transferase-like glycosyltransferase
MQAEKWLGKHNRQVMLAILAFAILARVAYYAELSQGPCLWLYRWSESDDRFFDRWAKVIDGGDWLTNQELHPVMDWNVTMAKMYFARHPDRVDQFLPPGSPRDDRKLATALWNRWYAGKTFHQEPLYPYAIALTYRLLGADPRWVFLWQTMLGVATTLLWWRLARRYFGELVALIAAVLIACYAPLYYLELSLVRTTLLAFLTAAAVSLADRAFEKRTMRAWLEAGIVFGISMLGQTTLAAFAVLCIAVLFWRYRRELPVAARFACAAIAGLLIGISPAVARNLVVGVPAFSLASNGPLTFISANDAIAATPEYGSAINYNRVEQVMDESDAKFGPAAKIVLSSHPSVWNFVWLTARKFAKFWQWYEEPDNQNLYYFALYSDVLAWSPTALLLSPLILVGLVLAAPRFEQCILLYAVAANGIAVALAASPVGRYRASFFAALIPFAALTLVRMVEWVKQRETGKLLATAGALVVAFLWISRPLPPGRRAIRTNDYLAAYHYYWIPEHTAAWQAGQWSRAAAILDNAVRHEPPDLRQIKSLAPYYSKIYAQLAEDLARAGDPGGAAREAQIAKDLAAASSDH